MTKVWDRFGHMWGTPRCVLGWTRRCLHVFPPPAILSFSAAASSGEYSVLHGSWELWGPQSAPCQVRTQRGGLLCKNVCNDGYEKKLAELNRS